MIHPRLRHRPFSLREARALGVEPARLSRSELVAPFRGARIPSRLTADYVVRCAALCAREPDAVLSHATAARLLGLPDLRNLPGEQPPGQCSPGTRAPAMDAHPELHLTVSHPARPPRVAGVRSHALTIRAREVRFAHGLPVTSAARTWADLAATSTIRQLVVLGDAIIGGAAPLAGQDDLRDALPPHRARGAARARWAIDLLDERAESPPESVLRLIFADAGLPRPDINVDLHAADGRFLARPDFRFAPYRVIVEYEGDHHRTDPLQWRRDLTRTTALQREGELVLRLGAEHLVAEKKLVGLLFRTLASRGWEPS
ncbi:hypothetical protein [Leifsonia lichenia]